MKDTLGDGENIKVALTNTNDMDRLRKGQLRRRQSGTTQKKEMLLILTMCIGDILE